MNRTEYIRFQTVKALAEQEGFDVCSLERAVEQAVIAFNEEAEFWGWRDGQAYEARDQIGGVLAAVRTGLRKWNSLPDVARDEVRKFVSKDAEDPVGPQLEFLSGLLEEYREHYGKPRGAPKKARFGDQEDLRPLEEFVAVMHTFWITNTDRPFGRDVTSKDPRDHGRATKGDEVLQEPVSHSIRFLDSLLGILTPRLGASYTVRNIETAVTNVRGK